MDTKGHFSTQQYFYGNGKFLLTAEYFVLDGALALALPLKRGQSLKVISPQHTSQPPRGGASSHKSLLQSEDNIKWNSYDHEGNCWFSATFQHPDFHIKKTNDPAVAKTLKGILASIKQLNPSFLQQPAHIEISTQLNFPRTWGLGTSSTLIHNLATWGKVDAFELLSKTMGGSGYDLACAAASQSILYQIKNNKPTWETCAFHPAFTSNLYFVYLGKKQNSREGIALYKSKRQALSKQIEKVSSLTEKMVSCKALSNFKSILLEHEQLVAETLGLPRAQDLYFSDYWGVVKSMGAWGGDFVLVTSDRSIEETKRYFLDKGFGVFLGYKELVLDTMYNEEIGKNK